MYSGLGLPDPQLQLNSSVARMIRNSRRINKVQPSIVFHFQFAQYFQSYTRVARPFGQEASAGCPKLQKLSPDDQQKINKLENAPRVLDRISGGSKPFLSWAMCIFVRQGSHPEDLNKIITFYCMQAKPYLFDPTFRFKFQFL
jgi:hypothetical protein